jgi:hypothetical protein
MNIYQKMFISLALISLTSLSNALDSDGTNILNSMKTAYINNFMPDKILTSTNLSEWKAIIDGAFTDYVTKNGTVARISDTLLTQSLSEIKGTTLKMFVAIAKARKDINTQSTFAVEALKDDIKTLQGIQAAIVNTETPLKKEPYYIPSKKNAQELLLTALEFMRGATETAIAQISRQIPSGY